MEQEKEEMLEKNCNCSDNCTCGDECNCNDESRCNDECTCNSECSCDDECDCQEDCCCNDEDDCNNGCCCDDDCCCNDEDDCDETLECENGVCEVKKKEKKKFFKKNDDKLKEYETKIKDLENKLLMTSADAVNYRKRKDEEVSRILKFCNEDIIKDLLSVVDNFERALKLSEDKTDAEFVKFTEGYKMIYCSMQNILEKFQVKAIDGANKAFDPVYHNAVMMESEEGVEPGMVLEVLQKGYLYKDKVVRPAMVKVSE